MKQKYIKKNDAFTLLELVFVIVVLGILAALAMPRLERDHKQEAADNILSAIRYTQHLALIDDKHRFDDSDKDWQKALWQIRFTKNSGKVFYTIATNMDLNNNLDQNESAIDPQNGKYMHSGDAILDNDESPNIFLTKKYGIDDVTFNDCHGTQDSSAKHIAFDRLGRPHRGITNTSSTGGGGGAGNDYKTYINNKNCTITFSSPAFDSNLTIEIEQETGYAFIVGQEDS